MKKKIILIILIIFFIIFGVFVSIYCIDQNRMKNNEPVFFSTWGKDYTPIEEKTEEIITEQEDVKEPEYVDTNPVKLGIYVESGNTLNLVTDDYLCNWDAENVMGLFYAVPIQEESISSYNFDETWKNYINSYENADSYRIGYSVEFTLNNGETFYQTILNPDDAFYTFPKVMSFLYDDVNLVPGKAYYHITQDVMYDYTICSSIKLVGDVETENITSDIKLTAFCFDSQDDFDENRRYRGNSFYTITIKKY